MKTSHWHDSRPISYIFSHPLISKVALPTKVAYKHELKASLGYDSTLRVTQSSDVCKVTYTQLINSFIQQWYQGGPKNEFYDSLNSLCTCQKWNSKHFNCWSGKVNHAMFGELGDLYGSFISAQVTPFPNHDSFMHTHAWKPAIPSQPSCSSAMSSKSSSRLPWTRWAPAFSEVCFRN